MKSSTIRNEILAGSVVIMPTETVYGLLVLERFQEKLYEIKQRPSSFPCARIFRSVADAIAEIEPDVYLKMMLESLLPGPFTILAKEKEDHPIKSANEQLNISKTIGIRIPDHQLFMEVIKDIEEPMVMTSANIHGQKAAISFPEAKAAFPTLHGIDGGICKYSRASAIIQIKR